MLCAKIWKIFIGKRRKEDENRGGGAWGVDVLGEIRPYSNDSSPNYVDMI
jgi:hypothetical protein